MSNTNRNNTIPLDPNFVAIGVHLDTSGSMVHLDMKVLISKIEELVRNQDQKKVIIYFATFGSDYSLIADGVPGNDFSLDPNSLKPNGLTALVPAAARHIRLVGKRLEAMKDARPGKVIFLMLTDGEQTVYHLRNREPEDAPYEGDTGREALSHLIKQQQDVYSWEFVFMGTNFDSMTVGESMGIPRKNCFNYEFSTEGYEAGLSVCSTVVTRMTDGTYEGITQDERDMATMSSGPNYFPKASVSFYDASGYEAVEDPSGREPVGDKRSPYETYIDYEPAWVDPSGREPVEDDRSPYETYIDYEPAGVNPSGFEPVGDY